MSSTSQEKGFCLLVSREAEGPGATPSPPGSVVRFTEDGRSVVFKGESHVEKVQVWKPTHLALECSWTGSLNKRPNITGFWRKDGSELTDSRLAAPLENQQYTLRRTFSIADEESLGNYSCVFDNEAVVDFILAAPRVGEGRDTPIVRYVGHSVVLKCKMEDPKPKPNSWNWYRANKTEKELIDPEATPLRYRIENMEGKTQLTVRNLTEADGGAYFCGAVYDIGVTVSRVDLRVIGFMEPLKPFLVVVAEAVVLVCVVLLYERGKARGSPHTGGTQDVSCGAQTDSTPRQRKV
ncbi:hypothetical protein NHX12_028228 [Muraenolepis orangiensis]|uniref:Ig-like domain-containing protein n=1 Tax=Muraenolepis orangiensis TaxID=630683 RepID=A0A9Q0EFH5_9TELE|nr:hypothetical protein NHX12_028228 [Muraenolepis orangiensis]